MKKFIYALALFIFIFIGIGALASLHPAEAQAYNNDYRAYLAALRDSHVKISVRTEAYNDAVGYALVTTIGVDFFCIGGKEWQGDVCFMYDKVAAVYQMSNITGGNQ